MNLKNHAIILLGNFFFGCSVIAIKQLSPAFMPTLAVNVARIITALVLFWVLYFLKKTDNKKIEKKDWSRLIVCALTGIVINQILFVKGSSLTSPIHASLLALTTPITIIIITFFINKDTIKKNTIYGVLLGIIGAAVLIFIRSKTDTQSSVFGDILIILNACSYAAYLVLAKPLVSKYSGLTIIRWAFTIGAFIIIPMGITDFLNVDFITLLQYKNNWWALIFVCVGATFLSYLCIMHGIATEGSQVVGSYIYTQPIFATIAAVILYKEPINLSKIVAAVLIFVGVYVVSKSNK